MKRILNSTLLFLILVLNLFRFNLPIKFDNISNFDLIGAFSWTLLFLHYFLFDKKYKETNVLLLCSFLLSFHWFLDELFGNPNKLSIEDFILVVTFVSVSLVYYITKKNKIK